MELITTQHYGGNIFSFYSTKRKDIFMTINELATGFGYKSKKGIEEMLRRKPYLKENKYSFMSKVPVRNYGTPQSVGTTKSKLQYQEVRLFTERGIFEIGCISHTAKAEQFRDWVFNQLKMLKNAFTKGMIAHTESKDLQKMLHDAVFNSPISVSYTHLDVYKRQAADVGHLSWDAERVVGVAAVKYGTQKVV